MLLAGLVLAATALAQAPHDSPEFPPEALLLARIRYQMTENLRRLPNYTCLETVERTRRPKGGRAQVVDTLRLEVALVEGKEMFAWPGAKRFEDRDLRELVTTGTFGNGNFAIHARIVFESPVPTFVYRGREPLGNSAAERWDFRVARAVSGYTLRVNQRAGIVGYHGSFWADPETLDVRRLEVFADDIPKELGAESSTDRIDYARLPIGGEAFLLPVESVLGMTMPEGEYHNFVRFTHCRQYTGESRLRFTEEIREDPPEARILEVSLPRRELLTLALNEEVPLAGLAVGDTLTATLRYEVKRKRDVLVPKGAVARGRILRIARDPDFIALGLTFTDLEWTGGHASVDGALATAPDAAQGRPAPRSGTTYQARPGESILLISPTRSKLSRGMLFYWRTE